MTAHLAPEDLYRHIEITDVAVSPDGERVAFVRDSFEEETDERRSSLFVVAADGGTEPRLLTRGGTVEDPAWSPDGDRLGFIGTREPDPERRADHADGPDDAEPQVWSLDMRRGGDAEQLTQRPGGVSEFDWAPDGERLVVAARDPTDEEQAELDRREAGGPIEIERLQHKFDGRGWLDTVTTYLFIVDTATVEETRLDGALDRSMTMEMYGLSPRWQPGGDAIAFLSSPASGADDTFVRDVYTVAPTGGDSRRVTDGDLLATTLAWSPTGDYLGFVGRSPDTWYDPPQVYAWRRGSDTYGSISASIDRTVAWPEILRWADEHTVLTMIGDEGRTRFAGFDVDGRDERLFEEQASDRTLETFDLRGGTIAACLSGPDEIDTVYTMAVGTVHGGSADPAPITKVTPGTQAVLGEVPLPAYRRVTFTTDGRDITGHLFYPPAAGDEPEKLPLVVQIHGGPQWYDAPRFSFDRACLVGRGYAVLGVDYRGSTSYGRAFCRLLRGRWDDIEVADVLAGVDAIVEQGWADPERLFVTGFSYGGSATAQTIVQDDRFVAAAPEHGVYDRRSCFGTDDAHLWWEVEYGLPWENEAIFDDGSVLLAADAIDTPTLVMAGTEDYRCPLPQAEQLYVALRKQGVAAKLVVYPGEHHDIDAPGRAIHRIEQLVEWFDRHDPATS